MNQHKCGLPVWSFSGVLRVSSGEVSLSDWAVCTSSQFLKCRPGTCKFIIFRIVFRDSTTRFWTPGKLWRCNGAYSWAHRRLHPSNPPRRPSSAGTQDPSLKKDVLLKKLNLWKPLKSIQIERNQKGVAHWTFRPATFKIINYFLCNFYLKGP